MSHGPLTVDDLLPRGPLRRVGRRVLMHDTVDSTNAFLLRCAHESCDGTVACAEFQSSGRGRLGRRWEAPRGSSVMLSVLLLEPEESPLLTQGALLAALAACEAIENATDCAPAVRWPNDIVLAGRKLGGVLAETSSLASGDSVAQRAVVLGVGINCLQHRGHFKDELTRMATSLELESTRPVHRAAVAGSLLSYLDRWLARGGEGPAGWMGVREAWRARCEDFGTRVTLENDGRVFSGTALGISDEGDLVVQLDRGGRRQFASAGTTRIW